MAGLEARGPEQHFWQKCESERAGLPQFLDLLNRLSSQYKRKRLLFNITNITASALWFWIDSYSDFTKENYEVEHIEPQL